MQKTRFSKRYAEEVKEVRAYTRKMQATLAWMKRHPALCELEQLRSISSGGISFTAKNLQDFREVVKAVKRELPRRRLTLTFAHTIGIVGVVNYYFIEAGTPDPYIALSLEMPIEDMPARFLKGKCAFRKKTEVKPAQTIERYEYSCEEVS